MHDLETMRAEIREELQQAAQEYIRLAKEAGDSDEQIAYSLKQIGYHPSHDDPGADPKYH